MTILYEDLIDQDYAHQGFGIAPLGIVPLGTSEIVPEYPILPKNIVKARFFTDEADYDADYRGVFKESDWIRQAVVIALATTKGTCLPSPTFGNYVSSIKKIDSQTQGKLNSYVRSALSHLTKKYIKINSIIIDNIINGHLSYTVYYLNLLTSKSDEVVV